MTITPEKIPSQDRRELLRLSVEQDSKDGWFFIRCRGPLGGKVVECVKVTRSGCPSSELRAVMEQVLDEYDQEWHRMAITSSSDSLR